MTITKVTAFPLSQVFKNPQKTSQQVYTKVSICLVRIDTDDGIYGVGECLGRFGADAYAKVIDSLFAPELIGREITSVKLIWDILRNKLNGRSGGMLFEAISGIDIALWDVLGKKNNLPVYKMLGGEYRTKVPVYASSIFVGEDLEKAAERIIGLGFKQIKLKIGNDVVKEIERTRMLRQIVGDYYEIMIDANYIYDEMTALFFARQTEDCRLKWFEEPINPENRNGYLRLSSKANVALAAGESEFTAHDASDIISNGSVKFIQPDITRNGGISESLRTAMLAEAFDVKYAPHVGFSGCVCVAASLQLAAALPNLACLECMITPNEFREKLSKKPYGMYYQVKDGMVDIPKEPGIGIDIDWDVVNFYVDK